MYTENNNQVREKNNVSLEIMTVTNCIEHLTNSRDKL